MILNDLKSLKFLDFRQKDFRFLDFHLTRFSILGLQWTGVVPERHSWILLDIICQYDESIYKHIEVFVSIFDECRAGGSC